MIFVLFWTSNEPYSKTWWMNISLFICAVEEKTNGKWKLWYDNLTL
jgi:hypothetical protein